MSNKEYENLHPILVFFLIADHIDDLDSGLKDVVMKTVIKKIPSLDNTSKDTIAELIRRREPFYRVIRATNMDIMFYQNNDDWIPNEIISSSYSVSISSLIFGYFCISWCLDPNYSRNSVDFQKILSIYLSIGNKCGVLSRTLNFFFKKVLKYSLSDHNFQFDEGAYISIFRCFSQITSYSPKIYYVFVNVCQRVMEAKSKISNDAFFSALLEISHTQREFLVNSDISLIVNLLIEFFKQFDSISLSILGYLSRFTKSSVFTDIFKLFPTLFIPLIESQYPECIYPIKEKPKNEFNVSGNPFKNIPNIQSFDIISIQGSIPVYQCESEGYSYFINKKVIDSCVSLSQCFKISPYQYYLVFLDSCDSIIEKLSNNFAKYQFISIILCLISHSQDSSIFEVSSKLLFKSPLFNQEYNIFGPNKLDKSLDILRNLFVDCFKDKDIACFTSFIEELSNKPCLLSEYLYRFRLLKDISSIHVLSSDILVIILNKSIMFYLEALITNHDHSILSSFSELIISIASFLQNSGFCNCAFNSKDFIEVYFLLSLLDSINEYLSDSLKRAIVSNQDAFPTKGVISFVNCYLAECFNGTEQSFFYSRIESVLSLVFSIFQLRPKGLQTLSNELMKEIKLCSIIEGEILLGLYLDFIRLFYQYNNDFVLPISIVEILQDKFRKLFPDMIKDTIYQKILQIIYLCSFVTSPQFPIKNWRIIPFILSLIGHTKECVSFLKFMNDSCLLGSVNIIALYKSGIDLILLQHINRNQEFSQFLYNGLDFTLNIPFEYFPSIVFPLISKIFSFSTDYCSIQFISRIIPSLPKEYLPSFVGLVETTLSKCNKDSELIFCLSPKYVPIRVDFIDDVSIEGGFSLSFKLLYESELVSHYHISHNIITLQSVNDQKISIFLNKNLIYASYESESTLSTVALSRGVTDNEFIDYSIQFQPDENVLRVKRESTGQPPTKMDLLWDGFASKNAKLAIGGSSLYSYDSSFYDIPFGYIKDVEFFINENKSPVFSILGSSCDSGSISYNIHKNDNFCKYRNILQNCHHYNLIESLTSAFIFRDDISIIELNKLIGIIQIGLTINTLLDGYTVIINNFVSILLKNKSILSYDLYYSCIEIHFLIHNKDVSFKWFSIVLMNFDIWSFCETRNLQNIFLYWNQPHVELFSDLIFRLPKERIVEVYFSGICKLNDHQLSLCCEEFLLNIVPNSSDSGIIEYLITFLMKKEHSELLYFILGLLLSIQSFNLSAKYDTSIIISFLINECSNTNIKVIEKIILLLHRFNDSRIHCYYYMIFKQIKDTSSKKDLFYSLYQSISLYPNLHSLLVLIASDLEPSFASMATYIYIDMQNNMDLSQLLSNPSWFIWPILLSYKISELKSIFSFIIACLNRTKRFAQEFSTILTLFCLVSHCFHSSNDHTLVFLLQFVRDFQFISENHQVITYWLFWLTFYDFQTSLHNSYLLHEFKQSPFSLTSNESPDIDLCICINNDMSILFKELSKPSLILSPKFSIRITDDMKWKDIVCAKAFHQMLIRSGVYDQKTAFLKEFISFFSWKSILSTSILYNLMEKMDAFIVSQRLDFKNFLSKQFSVISNYFRDLINFDIKVIAFESDSTSMFIEQNYNEKPSAFESSSLIFVRDPVSCSYLCPAKLKPKAHSKKQGFNRKQGYLFIEKCKLHRPKSEEICMLYVFNEYLIISTKLRDKIVYYNNISMVLPRSFFHGLEFNLFNGKSYLLTDIENDPNSILSVIYQCPISALQVYTKGNNSSILLECKFTHYWCMGLISSFEYIIKLNILSGRSFNNTHLYPIFPSIISDFHNEYQIRDFSFSVIPFQPNISRTFYPHLEESSTLKDILINDPIIIPEFYYFPEVISPTDELPLWATSNYEFIYRHRKLLESYSAKRLIIEWINAVFGLDSNKWGHMVLFSSKHPTLSIHPKKDSLVLNHSLSTDLLFGTVLSKAPGHMTLALIDMQGNLSNAKIKFNENRLHCQKILVSELSISKPLIFSCDGQNILYLSVSKKEACFVSKKSHQIVMFPADLNTDIVALLMNTFIYAADYSSMYCSVIDEKSTQLKPRFIHKFESRLVRFFGSSKFKVVCAITQDNQIHLFSTSNWRFITSIHVHDLVLNACITHSLGFIIIITYQYINVYNINGNLIKKCENTIHAKNIYPYVSSTGFDYIAYHDLSTNMIGTFEAFYPHHNIVVFPLNTETLYIEYEVLTNSFLIILRNGNIVSCPCGQL